MNQRAVKGFAIKARQKLISDITQKAYELGIEVNKVMDIETFEYGFKIKGLDNSKVYKNHEIKQRDRLILNIEIKGFEEVIEEVAYTWFNRFITIRFMEINQYLPTGVRVLSSAEKDKTEPDIIREALNIDLDIDKEIVYKLIGSNDKEDLYKYLLIKQCNELNKIMPMVFEKISDYTELLLPNNLLLEGSVIRNLVEDIDEEDFKKGVEIIGWMYQYYISEKKDEVFAELKKNKKITKENIPLVTQLFTPKWIVKYMLENSLGRLWLESYPDEQIKARWKYYLENPNQNLGVQKELERFKNSNLSPENIKILDPAMGSGHILTYAFDLLYNIYLRANYPKKDIPQLILERNLYGLDIDDTVAQLTAFALMMKARNKNEKIFTKKTNLNVCSIQESNYIPKGLIDYFCCRGRLCSDESGQQWNDVGSFGLTEIGKQEKLKETIEYLIKAFHNAKEYGSILNIDEIDLHTVEVRLQEIRNKRSLNLLDSQYRDLVLERLSPLIKQAKIIGGKYDVVCTNPPYMGQRGMNSKLSSYVKRYYPCSKADFFSVFMERCNSFTKPGSFYCMITQPSWLFLNTFAELRKKIINNNCIYSLLHMGRGIFGIDFGSTAFVIRNLSVNQFNGSYFKLYDKVFQYIESDDIGDLYLKAKRNNNFKYNFSKYNKNADGLTTYNAENNIDCSEEKLIYYNNRQENFRFIPGFPIAYWATQNMINLFIEQDTIEKYAYLQPGLQTSNNNKFLRLWFEVNIERLDKYSQSNKEAKLRGLKWFPYNKGGDFRRWYGNREYVVNWYNDGSGIKEYVDKKYPYLKGNIDYVVKDRGYYFKESVSWSFVSSTKFAARYSPAGSLFDVGGSSLFPNENVKKYIMGFLNSIVAYELLQMENPTLNFQVGNIASLPLCITEDRQIKARIDSLIDDNIAISKLDWDSFERSWDFKYHPLLNMQFIVDRLQAKFNMPLQNNNKKLKYSNINNKYKHGEGSYHNITTIKEAFKIWSRFTQAQFNKLKSNEEELNRIFIEIYGLQDELISGVTDKDITITKANKKRDIKSFISYAVGCMFGRYSLDEEGLIYAGGKFNINRYKTFIPTKDNILIITDDDYFEDDIVNRFVEFVKVTFGEETLEENLDYIAKVLGKKSNETSRQTIRRYFLKDFYGEHVAIYKRRPIYWLIDSGKANGFKALIYMHRYNSSTIEKLRIDYLHKLQKKYEEKINYINTFTQSNMSIGERVAIAKQRERLNKQILECITLDRITAYIVNQNISINLDDAIKKNYKKFQNIQLYNGAKKEPLKINLLAPI